VLLDPVRNPSEWPAAQQALRRAYVAERESLPGLPVRFKWFTKRVLLPVYANSLAEQFVAVFEPDAEPGLPPLVVFAIEPGTFTTKTGEAEGTIVGELAPNGALGLEVVDDAEGETWVIWPVAHPLATHRRAPRA
jgi:hypothetical protein